MAEEVITLEEGDPCEGLHFFEVGVDPSTFRNLVKEVSGRTISTQQASNLLDVFGEDLKLEINKSIRGFVNRHFGRKTVL